MEMKQSVIVFALPIAFFLVFAMTILPIARAQIPPPTVQRFELTISWFDCDDTTGGGYVTATYANFHVPSNGYEFSGANYWGFVYYQVNPVVVYVVAHPTDGWFLQSWTLDGVDIGNSSDIVVTTGCGLVMKLVAMFNPLGTLPPTSTFTLTINSESCNSETLPSDCTTTPSSRVYAFTQTTVVTANAGIGWLFNNWILDSQPIGDSTSNPISVPFDSLNHTLVAVFNPIPVIPPTPTNYTLTISKEASGSNKFAFGETDPAIGVYTYPANTKVNVTVNLYGEWYLEKWIFDGQDYANTTTFQVLMTTNHTLVAVFVPPLPPSLIADVNGDGIVNILDANIVEEAFASKPGDSNWNPKADLNHDGVVNMLDILMVSKDFGKTL